MTDNRNTILAVILSGLVLIGWQYFFNMPQMEKQRAQQAQMEQAKQAAQPGSPAGSPATPQAGAPSAPNAPAATQPAAAPVVVNREVAIAAAPRIKIETPKISGSIALKGARIDDLALTQFRTTVDPKSPAVVLFSPSGSPTPYYAEFGWSPPRLHRAAAGSRHAVAAGRLRQPGAEQPGDAEI